jgi:hypothetical protein
VKHRAQRENLEGRHTVAFLKEAKEDFHQKKKKKNDGLFFFLKKNG